MRQGKEGSSQNIKARSIQALLLEIEAAATIGFKTYFRYIAWLISDIITTPAWLIMIIVPMLLFLPQEQWRDPLILNSFLWAMVLWDIVSSGLWTFGMAIRREQQTGTLEFLLLTNANRAILFSRNIFTRLFSLTLSVIYSFVFFVFLFGINIILLNPILTLVTLLSGLVASLGFGLLYGAAVFKYKNVGPLTNILQFLILGICGIFFPVSTLPEPLRLIAYPLPFTYTADLLRHYALGTPTIFSPGIEWALYVLEISVYLSLGLLALYLVEKNLKATGQLGAY
ncbi:ABC-type multidrug transport system, permease component [Thermofilum adornatum 1505]|uniref:ABC-type multidrug transport system, permease component n=1 Tax=Thermofilum adornatum 1505 TaxID=697581 RepID=A0A3G1A515_9CREN|nr:ABC transporter permease [Thermofilum adornatum]AJB41846.1 ABC-type multidrug transport system, permease component [Thermofilum adornatum 1505]